MAKLNVIETPKDKIETSSWLTLLLLAFVWGSSFILIKKSLIAFDPNQVGALRIFISFITLLPFIIVVDKSVFKEKWIYFVIIALTGNGIPAFLFAIAQTHISSSVAGVLNSLTPIFTLILGIIFFGLAFHWRQLLGILLGLAGAVSIILLKSDATIVFEAKYALMAVLATLCYAISLNTVKKYLNDVNAITLSALAFSIIGPFAGIYLFGFTPVVDNATTHPESLLSVAAVSCLAIVGTVIATIIFYKLVQKTNPLFSSTVSYLIPFMAIVWGYLDGEMIHFLHFVSLSLILSGIYLIRN